MIRIGIIGCGRILAAHLRGYRLLREAGLDQFRITALCARNESDARAVLRPDPNYPPRPAVSSLPGDPLALEGEYLATFQPETEVEIHTDYRALIASDRVDAINDFTLHSLHVEIARLAAQHQKDLLTQKPIAVNPQEAQEMVALFEQRKLILGVCENWRYRPQTRHVKWAIDAGLIGPLQMLHFTNLANWWAPQQVVAHTPWRHRQSTGGGISLDIGPHLFHWVRHLGGEVRALEARTACVEPRRWHPSAAGSGDRVWIDCDADDTLSTTFETESGVIGSLNASWAGGYGITLGQGPQALGRKGRIDGGTLYLPEQEPQDLAQRYTQDCPAERQGAEFPHGIQDGFALLQHDWLQGITTRTQPEVTGREGLMDLTCAYAILESARTGQRIHPQSLLGEPT